jgi:5-methylthioadenosine/S-adenosylhomocysteine deaminase
MCDQDSRSLSRSSEIAAGATSAGIVATGPLIRRAAAQQPSVQPGRGRILFKGGVVITMDPTIGDLAQGDVLIDGARIAAVDPNLGRSRSAPTSFASM